MRAPDFWQQKSPGLIAFLLAPFGALYGAIAARRMRRPGWASGVPVICVGNLTAGGAGKTPLAIEIAQMLIAMGEAPFFLSRGYGGDHRGAPLRVDPARHTAAVVGDEPLLLARVAPTIVCIDRVAGAKAAVDAGAGVIVMDDGLQNPYLHKDLTFAAIDGGVGIGNGMCIPAGPLRAPLTTQISLVDAFVIVGGGASGDRFAALGAAIPILRAHLVVDAKPGAQVSGQRVVAFAGIGRPEKFFDTLRAAGAEIAAQRAFPDHHRFTTAELDALTREAKSFGAILVTTQKDQVRLPATFKVATLPVRLEIADSGLLKAMVVDALARVRKPL